jgi:hypothetical protein
MSKVVHFEIPAADLKRAEKFYSEIFGWKIMKFPMGDSEYHMAQTVETGENQMPKEPGAINGGLVQRSDIQKAPVIVLSVDSVEKYLKKVEQAGGKIVMPAKKTPAGIYGLFADTEGNVTGLWQDLN